MREIGVYLIFNYIYTRTRNRLKYKKLLKLILIFLIKKTHPYILLHDIENEELLTILYKKKSCWPYISRKKIPFLHKIIKSLAWGEKANNKMVQKFQYIFVSFKTFNIYF